MKLNLQLPKGWQARGGLPDMTLADSTTPWQGRTTLEDDEYLLDVMWVGKARKFLCRVIINQHWDQPKELQQFDYPHEAVMWVARWVKSIYVRQKKAQDE